MHLTDIGAIWKTVSNDNRPDPFIFKTSRPARSNAAAIDSRLEFLFRGYNDEEEARDRMNRDLRKVCVEIFQEKDHAKVEKLANWIIGDWGGIHNLKPMRVKEWLAMLGGFDADSIWRFTVQQKNQRISSWSKIVAFIDPTNHAIYDSRIATSLNVALHKIQDHRSFHMPVGRNTKAVVPAHQRLKILASPSLGYGEYIELLREFVAQGHAKTILDAEMIIFSTAPRVCKKFTDEAFSVAPTQHHHSPASP